MVGWRLRQPSWRSDQRCDPGVSNSRNHEHGQLVAAELPRIAGVFEGDRNRRRDGVAGAAQGDGESLRGDFHLASQVIQDELVGLVKNEEINLLHPLSGFAQQGVDRLGDYPQRELEDFRTVDVEVVPRPPIAALGLHYDGRFGGTGTTHSTGWDDQIFRPAAVSAKYKGSDIRPAVAVDGFNQ